MIVLAFPADEARRVVEGVQTVATYPDCYVPAVVVTVADLHELVGQTVAVARLPFVITDEWWDSATTVPGAIVGSVTVAACVPFSREGVEAVVREVDRNHPTVAGKGSRNLHRPEHDEYEGMTDWEIEHLTKTLCDRVNFSPGRWALIFTDPAPCEQRCPRCLGGSGLDEDASIWLDCSTCNTAKTCAPIPYSASGPIGEWTP